VGEDGMALVDLWWSIASDPMRRDADRLQASRLLAGRGWGKAAVFARQEGAPLDLANLESAAEAFRAKRRKGRFDGEHGSSQITQPEREP
jgi:hypothetical protein